MASSARFDGIDIPLVYAVEIEREFIGDRARTAGGKLRQDLVAVKRSWQLHTRPLRLEQANQLLDHLEAINYGPGDFWLDDFGFTWNTIKCIIFPESIHETHVEVSINGEWHSNARELSLTVVEV